MCGHGARLECSEADTCRGEETIKLRRNGQRFLDCGPPTRFANESKNRGGPGHGMTGVEFRESNDN
jgi:hypothetical protein